MCRIEHEFGNTKGMHQRAYVMKTINYHNQLEKTLLRLAKKIIITKNKR